MKKFFKIREFNAWVAGQMIRDEVTKYHGPDSQEAAKVLLHFTLTHHNAIGVTPTWFPVAAIRKFVNDQIARDDVSELYRIMLTVAYEHAAHEGDDYHGFNSLYWGYEGGFEAWREAGSPEDYDVMKKFFDPQGREHRRFYYGEQITL